MKTFLVCQRCVSKEEVLSEANIHACLECGSARYAQDENGNPLFMFSGPLDFESWLPEDSK